MRLRILWHSTCFTRSIHPQNPSSTKHSCYLLQAPERRTTHNINRRYSSNSVCCLRYFSFSSSLALCSKWVERSNGISDMNVNPSKWVDEICKIFKNPNPSTNPNSLEANLEEFCCRNSVKLSPEIVYYVLRKPTVQKKAKIGLRFFNWAGRQEGFEYNLDSIVAVIKSLGAAYDYEGIRYILINLKSKVFRNPNLTATACNILMNNFGMAGMAEEALELSGVMEERGIEIDVFSYNCLVDALVNAGCVEKAERVLEDMREGRARCSVRPDVVTYNMIVKGVCKDGRLDAAMGYLRQMVEKKQCAPDEITYVTLMQAFHAERRFDRTLSLFIEMSERKIRIPPHAYNLVIYGLCNEGKVYQACKVLDLMIVGGYEPNLTVYTALIDAFLKVGNKEKALRFLDQVKERGYKLDRVTCSTVINGLCKVGEVDQALEFLKHCRELGLDINAFSYCAMIDGLGKDGKIEEAENVFGEMLERGCARDGFCFNAIIDALCKAAKIDKAMSIFHSMEKEGCEPTVYTYTIMIDGLLKSRETEKALKLWDEMIDRGILPTAVSFKTLSTGLCLSGNVTRACRILDEMATMGVVPDKAYADMINVLCKAGRVKQACKLADGIIDRGREIPGRVRCVFINALRKAGIADLAFKMVHSRIGIGYTRSGRIKQRIKFRTLLE